MLLHLELLGTASERSQHVEVRESSCRASGRESNFRKRLRVGIGDAAGRMDAGAGGIRGR